MILKRSFVFLLRLYQRTLSLDHGPFSILYPYGFCRYYPSCSEYARRAIDNFGVIKGVQLSIKRIFRCTPFHRPKVDEVK